MRIVRAVVEWAAVLLVALGATLLLTSAAAYAECAWVLWTAPAKVRPLRWDAHEDYSTQAECEREGSDRRTIFNQEHPNTPITTRCFPDTIDPRSPKARKTRQKESRQNERR